MLNGGDGGDVFLVDLGPVLTALTAASAQTASLPPPTTPLSALRASPTFRKSLGQRLCQCSHRDRQRPGTYDFSAVSLIDIAGIQVGDGGQTIIAAAGDDVITGGANDNNITGGGGSNTLNGGEGDDTFIVTGGGVNL